MRVRIGNEDYRYEDLKDALDWDWCNLYKCPNCGWKCKDDDYDCEPCAECDTKMEFVEKEHYEL